MEFLKNFNWVDVLLLALLVRIVYISVKTGFVIEFMKTAAIFLAVLASFHFYTRLAAFTSHFTSIPKDLLEPAALALIGIFVVVVCKFMRDGFLLVFTVQTVSVVDRWGAGIVSLVRFFLTGSLLMFFFLATGHPYLQRMTLDSFARKYVLFAAPDTYRKVTRGFIAKVIPGQKVNPAVGEVLDGAGKQ